MGGKHEKYVYIKISDKEYVKARIFKNRADDDPDKYIITGPKRSSAPLTYRVIDVSDLPEELRTRLTGSAAVGESEETTEETG